MNMTDYSETPEDPQSQATKDGELRALVEHKNIADGLDEDTLQKISEQCASGFEYDLMSRSHWEDCLDNWINLALQVKEEKTWPWPKASNVKYPLLSTAAMQFNARSYPALVPSSGDLVKVETIGFDHTEVKLEKARRIGKYMSYQVLNEMEGWEEDMDKLLIMLPVVGTMFKKTYYNPVTKQNVSELVLPKDLVVNYWAKSLACAERVSELIMMSKRRVKEKQLSGLYLDVDLGDPTYVPTGVHDAYRQDETTPYTIVEQHTYYDLDEDGYSEPYIVTFERYSKKVLRIVARFDDTTIYTDDDGKLQKIDPIEYYTKFSFIPNPDGGFYDVGFGLLLSPINEAVNTLVNQLIDAGTINNLQGGFLGKGLRLKMGEQRFSPGEWKAVNSTADDLRKQIVPLPTKEPSDVLFQLMGTLVTSGKELASVAEIFVGKMPGQNTPATTTMATIEQGMKVFTAVYKRVYRSLKSEFKKIFALNAIYLDPNKYVNVLDTEVGPDDFDDAGYDVCPGADPNTATQTEKLMKAQGLMELLPLGILDPVIVIRRILEAQEQPNIEQLFNQQVKDTGQFQPPPDPKMMEMQMKSQMEQQKVQLKGQELEHKAAMEQQSTQAKMAMEKQSNDAKLQFEMQKAQLDGAVTLHKQRIFEADARQKQQQNEQTHRQGLVHAEEQNKSKIEMQKKMASAKPSATGKGTK